MRFVRDGDQRQSADGVFEMDFPFFERDVELMLEFVGDHAGGHRAEHLAVFARLHGDDAGQLGETLREFGHGVKLVRFAFGAALTQRFGVALVRLREVPGILGVSLRSGSLRLYAADPEKLVAEWKNQWPFPELRWVGYRWVEPDMEDVFTAYSQGYDAILKPAES